MYRWDLCQAGSDHPLESFKTKRAAEIAKTMGHAVRLYEAEGRWFAGESVGCWKPYVATATA
jgi:hypothetical protein